MLFSDKLSWSYQNLSWTSRLLCTISFNNTNSISIFCFTSSIEPTYLGLKLDRALTFHRHLVSLRQKLTTRVGLLRRLAGSSWGAGAITLRTATLALVHSTAEYCTPAWCRSAHTRFIDKPINDALRLVTECLRPTPTDKLSVLAGVHPS